MSQTNEQLEQEWSKTEKQIARQAFDRAYEREIAALLEYVRETAGAIASMEHLWQLHDFLSARRHDLDGKYDYRYSVLIFVFARLVREGWLSLDELAGLEASKLTKISALQKLSL
jgi:hypothetical protein